MHSDRDNAPAEHGGRSTPAEGGRRPPDPRSGRTEATLGGGEGGHSGRVRPLLGEDLDRDRVPSTAPQPGRRGSGGDPACHSQPP
eukprot:11338632-Alexandrium_andersonii.AAC.1